MTKGTKIYYTGDMANSPRNLEVTMYHASGYVDLRDIDDGKLIHGIWVRNIGTEYHGHCNPRFVTEEARRAYYTNR